MLTSHVPDLTVIRGCNVNVNGLSNKVQTLQSLIEKEDINLLCVTESHLTVDVLSAFVAIPHFRLISNDVLGSVHKHGVCVYIRDDLLTDNISFPTRNVLIFRLISYNLYIILVYRPPLPMMPIKMSS